jgi:drug/metabolite transporter (DMT)-like permease
VRPRPLEVAGIVVGFAGVLLLVQGAEFRSSPAGMLAQTTACFCWALGSVLSQRKLACAPGTMGYASQMLCGCVVLGLLSLINGESPRWPPTALAAAAWAYMVVFGSLIAFNAYMCCCRARPWRWPPVTPSSTRSSPCCWVSALGAKP